MQLSRGILIAIEGIDGSGKSTLAKSIAQQFTLQNIPTILTKEPGGTTFGLRLREILQNADIPRSPKAEFLLYAADRAHHFHELITPALAQKKVIISDRMADSALVYQGYGRGLDRDMIALINQWAMDAIQPDLTIYVRVDVATAWQRILQRNETLTAFEQEKKDFFDRLLIGFDELYRNRSDVIFLDGTVTPNELLTLATTQLLPWINTFQIKPQAATNQLTQ